MSAFDASYVWYGAKADQGHEIVPLKSALGANGWLFLQQEGFAKEDENPDKIRVFSFSMHDHHRNRCCGWKSATRF